MLVSGSASSASSDDWLAADFPAWRREEAGVGQEEGGGAGGSAIWAPPLCPAASTTVHRGNGTKRTGCPQYSDSLSSSYTHHFSQLNVDGKGGEEQHVLHHHHRHDQAAVGALALDFLEHRNLPHKGEG